MPGQDRRSNAITIDGTEIEGLKEIADQPEPTYGSSSIKVCNGARAGIEAGAAEAPLWVESGQWEV